MAASSQTPVKEPGSGRSSKLSRPQVPSRRSRKLAGRSALVVLLLMAIITGSLAGLTLVYSVDLPQIDELEHYRPSTTTDLYDRKGRIIGSFALERREVVDYDGFAPILRSAVISIEDKSFESHWGVNVVRIAGALWHDLHSRDRSQGASTLTMQLARNLFLSSDRTIPRKLQEAYLAIQIERTFTKQQIFTLYGNQIYLGSGMYGFEAASQFYFSKHAKDLSLTEAALLAGLPKGPYAYSPLLNPERALRRRNLVLSEMESDGVITHAQADAARRMPLASRSPSHRVPWRPWFQDEVRQELEKFGTEQVHEDGLRVDTTLDLDLQQTANHAVLDGIAIYERRHGWKGRLENVLAAGETINEYRHPDWAMASSPGDYVHALVNRVLPTGSTPASARPASRMPISCCCPPTGNGQASASPTLSSSPATSSTSIFDLSWTDRPPRHSRTGLRRAGLAAGRRQHQRRRAGHGRRTRLCALRSSTAPPKPSARPAPASSPMSTPPPLKTASSPTTPSSMDRSASAAIFRTTTKTTTRAA